MTTRLEAVDGGLAVHGDLDFQSVPALWQQVAERLAADGGSGELLIDLAAVGHSDSAGVALLVDWLRRAQAGGRRLRLRNVPAQMRAIIRVSSLEELLPAAE